MSRLNFRQFMCLSDNYGVLIHDAATGETASIDAPESAVIEKELTLSGWTLTHILTTHHHQDHVAGNPRLKEAFNCTIIGPRAEAEKIAGLDQLISGGETLEWSGRTIQVFDCPGHTKGHIAFYSPSDSVLFAADTIFAMGCGRILEGTPEQMFHSVNQFRDLPLETLVYCGHEYTQSNCRFALSVEPGNTALQERAKVVSEKRARGEMTCPTTIGEELETNPFMRCASAEIRKNLKMEKASDVDVFAELRERKNKF